jgi:hypothetical protein
MISLEVHFTRLAKYLCFLLCGSEVFALAERTWTPTNGDRQLILSQCVITSIRLCSISLSGVPNFVWSVSCIAVSAFVEFAAYVCVFVACPSYLSLFSEYTNGKERAALYSGLYRILCRVLPAEYGVVRYLVKI